MGTSGASCCEGRDDKLKKRMSMPLQKRKLPPINDEVDNVLDNFADFMRQKHRLDQERVTLRAGSGTLTGDAGGTIEGSGNLSVSGVPATGLSKHLRTLIKMQNVGSFQDKSYVVPSVFFSLPPKHSELVIVFKALSNLMNFTFKRQPTPKISSFFKIRKYRYPPISGGASAKNPDPFRPPRFSYEAHEPNFYADKFSDFLRQQRSQGLQFIGGVGILNKEAEMQEIEACFYTPTTKSFPFYVEAVDPTIPQDALQELLNTRLRQENMLFRSVVTLYDANGQVVQHLLVFESRDMPLYNFDFHVTTCPQEHWCEGGMLDHNQLATHLIKEEVINCSTLAGALVNKDLATSFFIFAI